MRREKNQYIFASEMTRGHGHKLRNAILLILPIVIAAAAAMMATSSLFVFRFEARRALAEPSMKL